MEEIRAVDANALVRDIRQTYCETCDSYNGVMCRCCGYMDMMDMLEDAPDLDMNGNREKEVWVMENPNHPFVYCSGCGMNVGTAGYIGEEFVDVFRYCPNCGCRMDGIVMAG